MTVLQEKGSGSTLSVISFSFFILNTGKFATTYQIGNDGGVKLDFKKNGHLKAEKDDHWRVTYYWGRYEMEKDSILMHIPLDFKLDKKAILTDTSLRFSNDTISFQVIRPND